MIWVQILIVAIPVAALFYSIGTLETIRIRVKLERREDEIFRLKKALERAHEREERYLKAYLAEREKSRNLALANRDLHRMSPSAPPSAAHFNGA